MSAKTILITDDESHMRRLLALTLAKTGATLVLTESGEEAREKAAAGPVDLLVIDVGLPGMSGFDTVKAIKAMPAHARLPVIMLTARGHTVVREEAAALGVSAFFTKPFSPMELGAKALKLLTE